MSLSFLAACADRVAVFPPGQTRTLVLRHPASGDRLTAVYQRGGVYDPAALERIALLFRDRRNGQVKPIDPALCDMLWEVRSRLGLPEDAPLDLVSGYRSPPTNAMLARLSRRVAENSYHIRGRAADIAIPGVRPIRVAEAAEAVGRGGFAWYARNGFTHLDTGPLRTWKTA